MPKNITKIQLKSLIQRVDFLSPDSKKEWKSIVDTLNQDQVNEVYKHFADSIREEGNYMLKLLVKAGLQNKYKKRVIEISKEFIKEAKKKEAEFKKKHKNK